MTRLFPVSIRGPLPELPICSSSGYVLARIEHRCSLAPFLLFLCLHTETCSGFETSKRTIRVFITRSAERQHIIQHLFYLQERWGAYDISMKACINRAKVKILSTDVEVTLHLGFINPDALRLRNKGTAITGCFIAWIFLKTWRLHFLIICCRRDCVPTVC